ncbi:MAG: histidine phosphatase family protein [Vagococcus sp.]
MKLYFTRHGKTEWNQEMRLQGMMGDSPLLPESMQQIELLGKELADVPFEQIYSSPSKRAKMTAEGICLELRQVPTIIYSDKLRELGLGELEGKKISWCRDNYPEEMHALRHDPSQYDPTPFSGELYTDMLQRSVEIVKQAVEENVEGPLLFVSHGATLTGCIQTLIGTPLERVRQFSSLNNNSLSVIDVTNGEYTLEKWNDTSFLN